MLLAILSVILNALAQVTMKSLAGLEPSLNTLIRSWQVYATLILYGTSILTWFFALRVLPLSIAYPLQALGYVVVTVMAWSLFRESSAPLQLIGLLAIVTGVVLISVGRTN